MFNHATTVTFICHAHNHNLVLNYIIPTTVGDNNQFTRFG